MIRAWGILNEVDDHGRLIPHPTVVMLDRDGVVRYVHTETNYRLRPPTSELLERFREITAAGDGSAGVSPGLASRARYSPGAPRNDR